GGSAVVEPGGAGARAAPQGCARIPRVRARCRGGGIGMKPGEVAHSVTRGAFYLAIEKATALLSGVAYFAILLRWMGPTKYGMMALALSFVGLATSATGNLEVFLERYSAEYLARNALHTLRKAHVLALLIKLALGVV